MIEQDLLDFFQTHAPRFDGHILQLLNDREAALSLWFSLSESQWSAFYGDFGRDIYKILCSSAQFPLKPNFDVLNGLTGLDVEGEQAYRQNCNVADALSGIRCRIVKLMLFCQLVQQTIAFCRDNPYGRVPFICQWFIWDRKDTVGILSIAKVSRLIFSWKLEYTYMLSITYVLEDKYVQPIYRCFNNVSSLFSQFINKVLANLNDNPSIIILRHSSRFTFGFLKNLLLQKYALPPLTKNADRIDFTAADGRISGECKSTPVLRSRNLISILQRMPQTSILHLVLVDDLQRRYFGKKVKKEVKLSSGCLNEQDNAAEESGRINIDSMVEGQDTIQQLVLNRRLVFLLVNAVDQLPVLREIKGLPSVSHNAQTAVIFIKLQLLKE
ncbi:hypothetical protein MP228_008268 [Amoeboaphelidium protococcarum]|nr:hypothetical protein MP228_008268 [Amoeboaphelidium protococcarum]